ncbi:MAG: glycosyltransferase family 4 protein [Phycisphaerae bacterium]|jgi:glycosyltransferase involved in cell wall biosynthesis
MKTKIKIAHVATSYQSVITILDSKLRELSVFDDLDVTVISSPPQSDDSQKSAVRYISVPMARTIKPFSDIKSVWQLYRVFKKEKFDIVHSHTSKAGFLTTIAAKLAGVPLIYHTHHGFSFYPGQNKIKYYLNHLLEKTACKFRDHTFSQSKNGISKSIELIESSDKVSFEGNGVDIDFIKKMAQEQLPRMSKYFPENGTKIVLVNRLEPVKRVDDFLKMVFKLKQDGLNVSCVIVGTGFLEDMLRKQVLELRLGDSINMIGFTDCVHGIIAAGDIVMLCSEKEGIPRALMEAMALQKPVIATDVEGTHELVVDGQTGFLVPLGDIDAMAEKVKLLAAKPELRKEMGSRGFDRVNEHFNDIKVADFLHNFYISRAPGNC